MTLRPAVPGDARALHRLERLLFAEEDYPLSLRSIRYHISRSLLLVAETKEGDIAGYALALTRRKRPKLYSLGVDPALRRGGVASLLLGRTFKELEAKGSASTVLEVRCDNGHAIGLYRKFGFRVTRRLKGFYRDGCDALWMERDHADPTLPEAS